MNTKPTNPQEPAPAVDESPYGPLPAYSASGRPATRADRIAFQVWIIMFLFIIVFTLVNYLLGWLIPPAPR